MNFPLFFGNGHQAHDERSTYTYSPKFKFPHTQTVLTPFLFTLIPLCTTAHSLSDAPDIAVSIASNGIDILTELLVSFSLIFSFLTVGYCSVNLHYIPPNQQLKSWTRKYFRINFSKLCEFSEVQSEWEGDKTIPFIGMNYLNWIFGGFKICFEFRRFGFSLKATNRWIANDWEIEFRPPILQPIFHLRKSNFAAFSIEKSIECIHIGFLSETMLCNIVICSIDLF